MNIVDSSGWLEYFADGPTRPFFATAIEDTPRLVVPTITIVEVHRRLMQLGVETVLALELTSPMRTATVVPLTTELAIAAAFLGVEAKLPLADSIILATARAHGATLWTQDANFEGMEGVRYVKREAR